VLSRPDPRAELTPEIDTPKAEAKFAAAEAAGSTTHPTYGYEVNHQANHQINDESDQDPNDGGWETEIESNQAQEDNKYHRHNQYQDNRHHHGFF
jgi:hypothetical protein